MGTQTRIAERYYRMSLRSGNEHKNPDVEHVDRAVPEKEFKTTAMLTTAIQWYCLMDLVAALAQPFFITGPWWSVANFCLTVILMGVIKLVANRTCKDDAPYLVVKFFEFGPWFIFPVCFFWGPGSVHLFSVLMGWGENTNDVWEKNVLLAMFGPTISAYTSWFHGFGFAFVALAIVIIFVLYRWYAKQDKANQKKDSTGRLNYKTQPRQYFFSYGVTVVLAMAVILATIYVLNNKVQSGDYVDCVHAEYADQHSKSVASDNTKNLRPQTVSDIVTKTEVTILPTFMTLTPKAQSVCAAHGVKDCPSFFYDTQLQAKNWGKKRGFSKTLTGNGETRALSDPLNEDAFKHQCSLWNRQAECMAGSYETRFEATDGMTAGIRHLLHEVFSLAYVLVAFRWEGLVQWLSVKSSIFLSSSSANALSKMLVTKEESPKETELHHCETDDDGLQESSKKYVKYLHFNQVAVLLHLRVAQFCLKIYGYIAIIFSYKYKISDVSKLTFDSWSFAHFLLWQLANPFAWLGVTVAMGLCCCNVELSFDIFVFTLLGAVLAYAMSKGVFGCANHFVCTLCSFLPVKQADVAKQETINKKTTKEIKQEA